MGVPFEIIKNDQMLRFMRSYLHAIFMRHLLVQRHLTSTDDDYRRGGSGRHVVGEVFPVHIQKTQYTRISLGSSRNQISKWSYKEIYEELRNEVWCVGKRKNRAFQRIKPRLPTLYRSLRTIISKFNFLNYRSGDPCTFASRRHHTSGPHLSMFLHAKASPASPPY